MLPRWLLVLLCVSLVAGRASADAHHWRISEIFSNADRSVQYIEMWETASDDDEFHFFTRWFQTNHSKYFFPADLPGPTANRRCLLATQAFAELPGMPAPDYIVPDGFVEPDGDTLRWFGYQTYELPPGLLPTDGVSSLSISDPEYPEVLIGSPANFSGASASMAGPAPLPRPWLAALAVLLSAALLARTRRPQSRLK